MQRRTQQEWLLLFRQHEQSGLTAAEFCREHQLNAKYFSKRKWDLNWKAKSSESTKAFVQVSRTEVSRSPASIQLTLGQTQLQFPLTIDPNWVAMLIKALA